MSDTPDFIQQWISNPPYWAEDIIAPWDVDLFQELEPFISEEYWTGQGSVNVFNVVGTIHPDYQNKSWLSLLENGKRVEKNSAYSRASAENQMVDYLKNFDNHWKANFPGLANNMAFELNNRL